MAVTDRAAAAALDAADPLSEFRTRFPIPDPGRIYLDGNSLGRPSHAVLQAIHHAVDAWEHRLVEGWPDWIELPRRVGDRLAAIVLGAQPGEVLACDSTTVNLYKLAHAALDVRGGRVVTDAGNFPTDRYVLEGVARQRGRDLIFVDDPMDAVSVPDAGLVCLSHVDYRTGALLPMDDLTARTDALVVWDLSHSVGAVPIDLSQTDLAVGCSYKYLNAGPGAPAFLYVKRTLQAQLRSPIQGWFGQREQFAMGAGYEAADGIDRFLAGTPAIAALLTLEASLELIAEAGIERIAAKGADLTDLAVELHDAWLAPLGFSLASPRDARHRGAHVALRHDQAWPICRALIERGGVVVDFRGPDIVRLGMPALYTRFVDVHDAMSRIRDLVTREQHLSVDATPRRVT